MQKEAPFKVSRFSAYNSENTDKLHEILDSYLENGIPKEIEYVEEWLLSLALLKGSFKKKAKDIITKKGSNNIKAVLKLKSRRDYTSNTANKNLVIDLKEIEELNLISTTQFAISIFKHVGLHRLVGEALDYFIKNASETELSDYFLYGCYNAHNNSYKYVLDLYDFNTFQVFSSVAKKVIDRVEYINISYHGKESIFFKDFDFSKNDIITYINIDSEAPFTELPDSLFSPQTLEMVFITVNTDKVPEGVSKLDNLRWFSLSGSYTTLPLEVLNIRKACSVIINDLTNIEFLSNEFFESPRISDSNKKEIKIALEKEVSYNIVLEDYKEIFKEIIENSTAISNAIDEYEKTGNYKELKIPELVLALCKFGYDDEHGRSSNKYYLDLLNKYAPRSFLPTINSLSFYKYMNTKTDYEKVKKSLKNHTEFDSEAFINYGKEMLNIYSKKYTGAVDRDL